MATRMIEELGVGLTHGDFNLDWLDRTVQRQMSLILPGYYQLVHEVTN